MAKRKEHKPALSDALTDTNDAKAAFVRANTERKIVAAPNFTSIYANDVQVQTSPWDLRLILGEIASIPTKEEPTVTIRQLGEVRLSPQLAKKLTIILFQQLQGYEKRFGEIPMPKD